MEFNNILSDTECPCLKGAVENTNDMFIRRTYSGTLIDKDFKTHWERGIQPKSNCGDICSKKGLSVFIKNHNIDNVLDKLKSYFKINPSTEDHYLIFQFKKDAGKLKVSETCREHYNFFKSDTFDWKKDIEVDSISKFTF